MPAHRRFIKFKPTVVSEKLFGWLAQLKAEVLVKPASVVNKIWLGGLKQLLHY